MSSLVEGEDGTIFSTNKLQNKMKHIKTKEAQYMRFCFHNQEKAQIMARVDIQIDGQAGDISVIPTNNDTVDMEDKMINLKDRMTNSLHLYKSMVKYEKDLIAKSSSVTTIIVFASQLVAAGIVISGIVAVLGLKKNINNRKHR